MENYKILLKEIKEYLHKWKDNPRSWIRRQYCQDDNIPSNQSTDSTQILSESQVAYLPGILPIPEIGRLILKCMWKCKGLKIPQTILQKRNKVGEPTCSNFKSYQKATLINNFQIYRQKVDLWLPMSDKRRNVEEWADGNGDSFWSDKNVLKSGYGLCSVLCTSLTSKMRRKVWI